METAAAPPSRFQRLAGFLDRDPGNPSLLADAAQAAFDEGRLEEATGLVHRLETIAPLPPQQCNLKGLIALARHDFTEAAATFESLLAENPDSAALRFNLAWAKAMLEDHAGVLEALTDEAAVEPPHAATLKVRALHHLGRLEDALEVGARLAEARLDDAELMGALATAAIDAEDLVLARRYAEAAGAEPEGLAVQGMLLLDESDIAGAAAIFEQSLATDPDQPRAAVGKGLALLATQQPAEAAPWLDKAAEAFGSHLGSWVAAGWAYFVAGDLASSRARFEKALELDDTFAETHGGLAVLDIAAGDLENARRRTEIALRLDRKCFSAALARMLLLNATGDQAAAERIREIALNTPIGQSGKTIAQAMVAMGAARGAAVSRRKP